MQLDLKKEAIRWKIKKKTSGQHVAISMTTDIRATCKEMTSTAHKHDNKIIKK